ncbi:hypothetical protein SLE2022_080640 [Rubroshorea leprosula]
MLEDNFRTSVPVVFYDGERETSIGNVVLHASVDFKALQLILSRKIGISPHQFSIQYAGAKFPYRRIPVTNKTNLWELSSDEDGFFIVSLRRTRRGRRAKGRSQSQGYNDADESVIMFPLKKEPPANAMLLRRVDADGYNFTGYDGFEQRLRNLQVEKQRYLVNMEMANLRLEREAKNLICEECERSKETGRVAGFHQCVLDAVVTGFRSAAGPIARPAKGSG